MRGRSSRGWLFFAASIGALMTIFGILTPAVAQTIDVSASVETDPVPSEGDAADDPAIWVHPADPSLSTIIGTDKEGGLAVYDLSGRQLQYISGIRPNNVDIRHDFPLGGQTIDLVVSSERDSDVITLHRVDPQSRQLTAVGSPVATGMDIYGICAYRSPVSGRHYVFVTSEEGGPVGQFELVGDGSGGIRGNRVREFTMATTSEGCVADEQLGYLYVAEEDVGVWKYSAEPDGGSQRVQVDGVGARLEDDVEGMTIYYGNDDAGYLIVSSQGSDEFVVYERAGDNRHLTTFQIADSPASDGAANTDGIDVISTPLGSRFPRGVFVAQDGENDPQNQNFKLVPWETIAQSASPALLMETGWNPRGETAAGPPPSLPTEQPGPQAGAWSVANAAIIAAEDDAAAGQGGESIEFAAGGEVTLRFSGLDLAAGATLRRAHVSFTSAGDDDGPVVLTIRGVLGSGAETAPVTWAPAPWEAGQSGAYQQTPDISRLMVELVEGGWESGDPVVLRVTSEGAGRRSAVAYEADPEAAPRLRLEFTSGT